MKYLAVFLLFFLISIPNISLSETSKHELPNTLYSKERILELSDKLLLTEDQLENIATLSTQYDSESVYLSKKIKILSDRFLEIVGKTNVNRTEASLVLNEISSVEKVQKERTLLFLIDLKNILTKSQQEILSGNSN